MEIHCEATIKHHNQLLLKRVVDTACSFLSSAALQISKIDFGKNMMVCFVIIIGFRMLWYSRVFPGEGSGHETVLVLLLLMFA